MTDSDDHHTFSAARPTQSYLRNLFEANGLQPRRQLGQNFLIDLNLLDLLVQSSMVGPSDVVLEVGAGTGGLTTRLAQQAGRVVSIEIDPGVYMLAKKQVSGFPNVTLIHTDVLENKNHVSEEVLAAVREAMAELGTDHYHLVANLPYDVATSVIGNLLLEDLPIRSMTTTVQFEMAQRLVARPGSKDYGPVSVLVSNLGEAEWIRSLPPQAFWPRPKVRSAIVRIVIDEAKRGRLEHLRQTHRFVRDLFIHRRKNLRSAIASIPGYKQFKPQLNDLLQSIGLGHDSRAEELPAEKLDELFTALQTLSAPTAAGPSTSGDE